MNENRSGAEGEWRHDADPNWERLGFVGAACWFLGRPPSLLDGDGYEDEVVAAALPPADIHVAWVRCRQKQKANWLDIEYRLLALVDGVPAIDWVVETYNPYFGCRVGYLAWHGDRVVMVYREKHRTYACSLAAGGEVRLVEAADNWRVVGGTQGVRRWRSPRVERLSLPGMRPLDPLAGAEARATGLLGEG